MESPENFQFENVEMSQFNINLHLPKLPQCLVGVVLLAPPAYSLLWARFLARLRLPQCTMTMGLPCCTVVVDREEAAMHYGRRSLVRTLTHKMEWGYEPPTLQLS